MKTRVRKIVGMASFLILLSVTAAYSQEGKSGGRLGGTWDAAVTLTDCATGAPIRTFYSVGAFHQGGTFSGITSGTPPLARSPELGIWKHVRGDQYVFRFKAFLFDAMGNPTAYQILTHTVELDQDNMNYTSAGGVQIYNMTGTQIATGCSTGVGTRLSF